MKDNLFSKKNLERIQVGKHLSFRQIKITHLPKKKFRIKIEYNSFDRDTGKSIFLWHVSNPYKKSDIRTERQLLSLIRKRFRFFLLHEMDESLYLDGKRIYEPPHY